MFLVFGSGLGPAALSQISAFPLLLKSAETSMKVTANSITLEVPMAYTLAPRICGILLSSSPAGTGTLTVTYNNQTSAPATIKVVKTAVINSAKPGQAMIP